MALDKTHDPARRSWVDSANGGDSDFPIQNLPLGIYSRDGGAGRPGVAIGDMIVDLRALGTAGLVGTDMAALLAGPDLDALLAAGSGRIAVLRATIGDLLDAAADPAVREAIERSALVPMTEAQMHVPTSVPGFTDFFAGIYHAEEGGRLTKADPPLTRNYGAMPLGYNGRASSVRISGEPVRRPLGQRPVDGAPEFGPSRWLDFELELGVYVAQGNDLGAPIPIGEAGEHIAGYSLVNDWSARDIQFWENQPLGAFNSKGFSTTVSPWIVTQQAMAPFRAPLMDRLHGHPAPPRYLSDADDQARGGLDIQLEAWLSSAAMRDARMEAVRITATNARHLYWTFAQMVTQHSCGGTNLRSGDLIGSGTISGPTRDQFGSMAELSAVGTIAIPLPTGETRGFLEDGDEVSFRARCVRDGFVAIGFGDCSGRIIAAPAVPN